MRKALIIIGVVLLILGCAVIIHPNFTYSKNEQVVKVGPVEANVQRQDTVQVPLGVAILLLVAGLGLVVMGAQVKK